MPGRSSRRRLCPCSPDDTAEAPRARILRQEHRLYPEVVRWFAEGRISLDKGRVAVKGYDYTPTLLFSSEP